MNSRFHEAARSICLLVVAVVGLTTWVPRATAQTPTETKIRMMADALRARDAGDLDRARKFAEELLKLLPNDPNVKRLIGEIDTLTAAREEAARNPPPPPPMQEVTIPERTVPGRTTPAAPREDQPAAQPATSADVPVSLQAEADALGQAEARRIASLVAETPRQRQRARKLAAGGHFDEAIGLLDAAIAALPLNPMTKPAVAELHSERDAIVAKQAESAPKPASGESAPRAQLLSAPSIFDAQAANAADREKTRAELLENVTRSWQRPSALDAPGAAGQPDDATAAMAAKLQAIVLPQVSFTRTEIGQVVAALSAIAEEFDGGASPKGVNIVLIDPSNKKPAVTLTLRNASLRRVLDFVTESVGYQYEVQPDAVVVRPGGETPAVDTAFFPVARATVLRMTNSAASVHVTASRGEPPRSAASAPSPSAGEGPALKAFLQQAGVNFENVPGSSLAYDGAALIVTQTPRNLTRIRNILERYRDVRQVEIEAKFIEVQDGALEELGVQWTAATKTTQQNAGARATYQSTGRSLAAAFGNANGAQTGRIVRPAVPAGFSDENGNGVYDPGEPVSTAGQSGIDIPITNNPPTMPGGAELGFNTPPLITISGVVGEFDVTAVVRALSQHQGTDLLSAPKVTVLSGSPATITVAQEMRYPQSFGQTQSQVGTGNANGGGSAGVAITAGTPQEFTKRNIGVELNVTPTVEEDDFSISLDLNPRVTEFDGFVEYGGPSIAISGGTTVTVPSGFFQPIFSVRDIATRVTIWDGATLVMGGLTREEVKKVDDKIPLLGDLPLIGRVFRTKGESAQKRNLLIFVTANLVNPGGAPKQQRIDQMAANLPQTHAATGAVAGVAAQAR